MLFGNGDVDIVVVLHILPVEGCWVAVHPGKASVLHVLAAEPSCRRRAKAGVVVATVPPGRAPNGGSRGVELPLHARPLSAGDGVEADHEESHGTQARITSSSRSHVTKEFCAPDRSRIEQVASLGTYMRAR